MATPNFIHGKLGTISLGGSLFNAESFEFVETAPLEDITYSRSGGASYADKIPGYSSVSGTITFVYDTNNQPVISPYNMLPQQSSPAAMILYPDGTKAYSFNAYFGTLRWSSGPKAGACRCTATFESTGTVTHPSS
jgi:hypothetical protein